MGAWSVAKKGKHMWIIIVFLFFIVMITDVVINTENSNALTGESVSTSPEGKILWHAVPVLVFFVVILGVYFYVHRKQKKESLSQ